MMKCDMCYDRTSVGKKPMCASVCPSQALYYGTREEIERLRPRSRPLDTFVFGHQTITTKVNMMVPRETKIDRFEVLSALVTGGEGGFDPMLAMLDVPDCVPDGVHA
jgi:Fe-S-cluster-containing dehydrogenase component